MASFNQKGHEWALAHLENSLGAEVEQHVNTYKNNYKEYNLQGRYLTMAKTYIFGHRI